jgi:hypothetical protein
MTMRMIWMMMGAKDDDSENDVGQLNSPAFPSIS